MIGSKIQVRLRRNGGQYMCACGTEIAQVPLTSANVFSSSETLEARFARSFISPGTKLVFDARLVRLIEDDASGRARYGLPERGRRRLAPHKRAQRGGTKKSNSFLDLLGLVPSQRKRRERWRLKLPAHVIAYCPDCRRRWEIDTAAD